ncbi:MAG: TetR/AcrR family transcriptional regulator [Alphaproteobacteria bacterium]
MARKKQTDDQRAARREEILDAAMHVFETQGGIAAVSFRNVAAKAGISYSAPYRYFTDKDDLLNALRARAFRWIESEMKQAMKSKRSATAKLEALARAYVTAGVSCPDRYELMFFELDNTDIARNSLELRAAKNDALGVCTDVIIEGQESGAFSDHLDPLVASHLFWTGAHGLVSLEVSGQFVMGCTIDQLIAPLFQTLQSQILNSENQDSHTIAANG